MRHDFHDIEQNELKNTIGLLAKELLKASNQLMTQKYREKQIT